MTRKPSPAAHVRQARHEAAKELAGIPADDSRITLWASLKIALDNMHAVLGAGGLVDVGNLLKIHEAMAAIRASLPPPKIEVAIKLVEGGWSAKEIEGKAVEVKPAEKNASTPKATEAAPAPVSPPPAPAPPRNPSMAAWMNAHGKRYGTPNPGPDMTSKYNYDNSAPVVWSGYAGRPSNATPADPNPSYDASGNPRTGHPLPTPNGKGNGQ
jgi:hypothetical protein